LDRITNSVNRSFVHEAIVCFEAKQYRAAVVFSWAGALSLIHSEVAANHLPAFNAVGQRRNDKWKTAKNTDDLGRVGEHDFLDIAESIGVIGKNVCLDLGQEPAAVIQYDHEAAAWVEVAWSIEGWRRSLDSSRRPAGDTGTAP
jgi:hypothetical protein